MVDRGLDRRLQDSGQWLWLDGKPVDRIPKLVSWQPSRRAEDKLELIGGSGREMRWMDGRKQYRGAVCQYTPKTQVVTVALLIFQESQKGSWWSEAGEHKYPWNDQLVDTRIEDCGGTLISVNMSSTAALVW